jgi:hypothetical protein
VKFELTLPALDQRHPRRVRFSRSTCSSATGKTLPVIVPVLEEIIVVEKHLMLVEEVHIRRPNPIVRE